jgi:hypothetical protein
MSIKWAELAVVALATVVGSGVVVLLYSLGVRLYAVAGDRPQGGGLPRAAAVVCFALCGAAVLFGIYLIIPYFHS